MTFSNPIMFNSMDVILETPFLQLSTLDLVEDFKPDLPDLPFFNDESDEDKSILKVNDLIDSKITSFCEELELEYGSSFTFNFGFDECYELVIGEMNVEIEKIEEAENEALRVAIKDSLARHF